jgi:hypothetical protein
MQTQDLVYDMYEASEASGPALLGATGKAQLPSDTPSSEAEIPERGGIRAVRSSRSGTASLSTSAAGMDGRPHSGSVPGGRVGAATGTRTSPRAGPGRSEGCSVYAVAWAT